jgi:P-type Ca2+ transporter type 2B
MLRNIVGQALYQLIVMMVLVFQGDTIFNIPSGRGLSKSDAPTEHYTLVFTTFVMMQIFNQINARKLHDERNIFAGITSNPTFIVISLGEFFMQVIITQLGGQPFKCAGLTAGQWGAAILIGLGCMPYAYLLRMIPRSIFPTTARIMTEPSTVPPPISNGRALWVRSVTRIQTQLAVVKAMSAAAEESRKKERPLPAQRWQEGVSRVRKQMRVVRQLSNVAQESRVRRMSQQDIGAGAGAAQNGWETSFV